MRRSSWWVQAVLVFIIAGWLGSCSSGCAGPLPGVGPLVTASAVCHEATIAAGREVVAAVRAAPGGAEPARRLARAWAAREHATRAMIDYAAELRTICEQSDASEARAKSLSDRLANLAAAAGFVMPGAGVVPIASASAAMVFGQIERARAAKDLAAITREAQGAVSLIAGKLAEDHDDLALIIDLAFESMAVEVASETAATTLADFRREAHDTARRLIERGEAAMTDADRARLVELAALVAATDPAWAEITRRLAAIEQQHQHCREIIARMGEAARAWASAHAAVARAIEAGGSVNVDELVLSVGRLREAVRSTKEAGR